MMDAIRADFGDGQRLMELKQIRNHLQLALAVYSGVYLSLYPLLITLAAPSLPLIFLPSLMDLVPLGFNSLVESVPQIELK